MDGVIEFVTNHWSLWLMILFVGFVGFVAWVFWPGRKKKLEELGKIPLKDENGKS